MDLTTATPPEIDTEIAKLQAESANCFADAWAAEATLNRLAEMSNYDRRYFYTGPNEDSLRETIANANRRRDVISAEIVMFNAEYIRRGGWTRFYLVEDGHLHYDVSSYRCSRQSSTTHYWLTEFSGQDGAEVIALAGERVCTNCFPDAPVAPRPAAARFMTVTEAEKAAYTEDTARKRAAKKAAELRTVDGQPLIVGRSQLKTERAANNRAMEEATALAWYGDTHPSAAEWRETIAAILPTLAHVRQTSLQDQVDLLNRKVAAKVKRDGGTVEATV